MCQLIEEIAKEKGMKIEDANYIYNLLSAHILNKIPELSQVIHDVFENANSSVLKQDIDKAIRIIQEQDWKEKFCNYIAPQISTNYKYREQGELF